MTWLQRKMASAILATPPTSTFEEVSHKSHDNHMTHCECAPLHAGTDVL